VLRSQVQLLFGGEWLDCFRTSELGTKSDQNALRNLEAWAILLGMPTALPRARRSKGWFYLGMALTTAATAIAGFAPALLDPAGRKAPLTWAVAAHGALFGAWLVLFIAQTTFVRTGQLAVHRRIGYVAAVVAVLMVVTAYPTTIAMARRGFDISGDLSNSPGGAREQLVFQLGDLVSFTLLVGAAVWQRQRPAIHKRLMVLATVGGLMPAALAHFIGHSPALRHIEAPIILIPLTILYFATAIHDRWSQGRMHPVSLWVAVGLLVWANVRAALIGPSTAWREFTDWLIR